jgi:hypothetical protein
MEHLNVGVLGSAERFESRNTKLEILIRYGFT